RHDDRGAGRAPAARGRDGFLRRDGSGSEMSVQSTEVSRTLPTLPGAHTRDLPTLFRRYGLQSATALMAIALWIVLMVGAPETWLHFDIYSSLMSTVPLTGIV